MFLTVVQASDYEGKEIFKISEWQVSHAGVGWSDRKREQMRSFLRHQGYYVFLILKRFSIFLIMHIRVYLCVSMSTCVQDQRHCIPMEMELQVVMDHWHLGWQLNSGPL